MAKNEYHVNQMPTLLLSLGAAYLVFLLVFAGFLLTSESEWAQLLRGNTLPLFAVLTPMGLLMMSVGGLLRKRRGRAPALDDTLEGIRLTLAQRSGWWKGGWIGSGAERILVGRRSYKKHRLGHVYLSMSASTKGRMVLIHRRGALAIAGRGVEATADLETEQIGGSGAPEMELHSTDLDWARAVSSEPSVQGALSALVETGPNAKTTKLQIGPGYVHLTYGFPGQARVTAAQLEGWAEALESCAIAAEALEPREQVAPREMERYYLDPARGQRLAVRLVWGLYGGLLLLLLGGALLLFR